MSIFSITTTGKDDKIKTTNRVATLDEDFEIEEEDSILFYIQEEAELEAMINKGSSLSDDIKILSYERVK